MHGLAVVDRQQSPPPAPPRRAGLVPRLAQAILTVAVVAGLVTIAPRWGADLGAIRETIDALTWQELAGLALASLWNIVTYWFLLVAALPGLRLGRAAMSNQASTAVSSTALGGGAVATGVTYAMYRSWGFTPAQFALATLASGVWTVFVKLAVPVLALVVLAVQHDLGGSLDGDATALLVRTTLLGAGVFAAVIVMSLLILGDARPARWIGNRLGRVIAAAKPLLGRPDRDPARDWGATAVAVRADTLALLRTRWRSLSAAAVISHLSLFTVLLLSLRLVGVSDSELPWEHVLAAFAFVELLSALPLTPGALGVAELGYGATLAAGLPPGTGGRVIAAVLLYRAITYLPPIPIGAACYLWWRRTQR